MPNLSGVPHITVSNYGISPHAIIKYFLSALVISPQALTGQFCILFARLFSWDRYYRCIFFGFEEFKEPLRGDYLFGKFTVCIPVLVGIKDHASHGIVKRVAGD